MVDIRHLAFFIGWSLSLSSPSSFLVCSPPMILNCFCYLLSIGFFCTFPITFRIRTCLKSSCTSWPPFYGTMLWSKWTGLRVFIVWWSDGGEFQDNTGFFLFMLSCYFEYYDSMIALTQIHHAFHLAGLWVAVYPRDCFITFQVPFVSCVLCFELWR